MKLHGVQPTVALRCRRKEQPTVLGFNEVPKAPDGVVFKHLLHARTQCNGTSLRAAEGEAKQHIGFASFGPGAELQNFTAVVAPAEIRLRQISAPLHESPSIEARGEDRPARVPP